MYRAVKKYIASFFEGLSIKIKFLILTGGLALMGLLFLIIFNDQTLRDDVRLRIAESNLFRTQIVAEKLDTLVNNISNISKSLLQILPEKKPLVNTRQTQDFFENNPEIIWVTEFNNNLNKIVPERQIINEKALQLYSIQKGDLEAIWSKNEEKNHYVFQKRNFIENQTPGFSLPLISIHTYYASGEGVIKSGIMILMHAESLLSSLAGFSNSEALLVDLNGRLIVHSRFEKMQDSKNYSGEANVLQMLKSNLSNGLFYYNDTNQEGQIAAFRKLPDWEFSLITSTPEKTVLKAVNHIRIRNYFISLIILALILIIILMLSRSITRPLQKVISSARKYLDQRFEPEVSATGNEVTILERTIEALENSIFAGEYEKQKRFVAILDSLQEAVAVFRKNGQIEYTNLAFQKIYCNQLAEGSSLSPTSFPSEVFEIFIASEREKIQEKIDKVIAEMATTELGLTSIDISRKEFPTEVVLSPIRDYRDEFNKIVMVIRDISEKVAYEEKLKYEATHDSLTGLPNRAFFMEKLRWMLANLNRNNYQFAIFFLDVDKFKSINDNLGHEAGDQLLIEIALRLSQVIRTKELNGDVGTDVVSRLGGDEFAILLGGTSGSFDVVKVAERIIASMQKQILIKGNYIDVSCSIGIVNKIEKNFTALELLRNADIAMYKAKSNGRNRFELFDDILHSQAIYHIKIENELKKALEFSEFAVHFQPVYDIADNSIIFAEALIRWNSKERGMVSPLTFLPVAEETNLILKIGYWLLRRSLENLELWQNQGIAIHKVSINLSHKQIFDKDFSSRLMDLLLEFNLSPENVILELTEKIFFNDMESGRNNLLKLKEHGFILAMDDFGTGYSSLGYLAKLPVDIVKIDKSFVDDIETSAKTAILLENIIEMCNALNIQVVIEGIETKKQMKLVNKSGGKFIQGYYLSKPLNETQILNLSNRQLSLAVESKI